MTCKPGLIQSPLDSGTHENVFLSPRTKAEEVTRRETRERPGQTTRLLLIHDEISISHRSNERTAETCFVDRTRDIYSKTGDFTGEITTRCCKTPRSLRMI